MALPEVGQDVLLKAANVELFGRVVWRGDGQRGIEFDQPIGDAALDLLRDALARELGRENARPDIIRPEGRRGPQSKPNK